MKVCILDNGITSLTLAKALVNQKIYVDIISNKNSPTMASRTIGISRSNVEFFNSYILNIDKIIWKLNKIEIFTDNLKKEKLINFENNGDELFSIVRNIGASYDITNCYHNGMIIACPALCDHQVVTVILFV